MAYDKQTWVRGEKVASAKLNHMEEGIAAIFANGAINTANLEDGAVTTPKIADGAVTAAKLDESATDIVADTFSASTAYSVGDYCIYSGALYRFTADKTAGSWDSTKVVAVALADDVANKVDAYTSVEYTILNKRVNYPNGNIVTSNKVKMTDYIPCEAGTKVDWNGWSFFYQGACAMYCVAFYNASKQFISGITQVDGSSATTSQLGKITTIAPENSAFVVACSNNATYIPYLHTFDIDIKQIKSESREAYLEMLIAKQMIQSPVLSNGSGGNPNNANGVTARAIPFYDAVNIVVKNNRPVSADGNYYVYDISAFKGTTWYTNKITNLKNEENGTIIFESAKVIDGSSVVDGFGVTIWEYNSSDVLQTLRIGDFSNGDLIVRYVYEENIQTHREIENETVLHDLLNARHIKGGSRAPLTILHFSDLHGDTAAMSRIIKDSKGFNTAVDEKICTGDMVANTAEHIASWWDSSVLTCIGNHDTASYSNGTYDWTALSMADRDAYYIAPFESGWGITHTSGKSYYYKDYATQKVRLIVMDAMLCNDNGQDATDQTAWLSNLLSSAITSGYHVLIAIHAPHGGATAEECSFSKYGQTAMPTYTDCNTPQSVIDAVASAISNGLHFIGYIVGHTHQDNIWDAEGDGKQHMYCVTCAAQATKAQWNNSDQDRSGKVDAYNLISIDTMNTLVKIVRGGGANIDDHMRTRKAICFNYSTGEKVGEIL